MIARLVKWLMRRDLRGAFRRVVWTGPLPLRLPREAPLVLYANHHSFHDGHLIQLLLEKVLDRPGTIWMEDWDRFPFFAAVGAQPFPPDDAKRRRATIRRTARRMREQPATVLVYFPEGRLHPPPSDGSGALLDFPDGAFARLARLLPAETCWWPVALRLAPSGDARPTALLRGGPLHTAPDGRERERLRETWNALCPASSDAGRPLLDGRRSPAERWDFSVLAPFFERYL